jgi:Mlc titration factor MtfA (ptsG expression regulator)
MLRDWWRALGAKREQAALKRRAIPNDMWKRTLVRYPFLQRQQAEDAAELRRLTSLFLDSKEFSTTGGLRLTDAMAVAIAAQASLPVLRMGLTPYQNFVGIVVHPDAVMAPRSVQDPDGVVHEYTETLAGEAMDGGPVMLSWPDVRRSGHSAQHGYNVVIHEFAHVLDMATGQADGMPALPAGLPVREWRATLQAAFTQLEEDLAAERPTLLDPYGATGPEEFFAVASEAFFVAALDMKKEHPALYGVLSRYYLQDPAADMPPLRRS